MNSYRVRIRRADFELEVESSDKDYVEEKLAEFAPRGFVPAPVRGVQDVAPEPSAGGSGKALSLVEHVRRIAPKTGSQYVIAVGHYLETTAGMADGFKTRDITDGFRAAKFKHSNPAEAVRQAKQQGFLMDGTTPNTMVLTQSGEAWVKGQLSDGNAAE